MGENITTASREWSSRPDDQRFLSLADLRTAVSLRKEQSWTAVGVNKQLRVLPKDDDLLLEVYDPTKAALRQLRPSHWSFGQLASYAKAPAGYLRQLPGELAAINLQFGLEHLASNDKSLVLARTNGDDRLTAMTSPTYGRIWDLEVVDAVIAVNQDGRWRIPAASYANKNPKRASTLYASDRDIFLFLVDDKNEIAVPTGGGREKKMFRGFFTWNSEVGSTTFGLTTFLYDFVCDNRIIWGAEQVKELVIRHTGGAPERFKYEGGRYLKQYADQSTVKLIEGVKTLQKTDVPISGGFEEHNDKLNNSKITDWLTARGFTKAQASGSVQAAVAEEGQARSVWDIINGVTAYARSLKFTDERVSLERKAGELAKKVAVPA